MPNPIKTTSPARVEIVADFGGICPVQGFGTIQPPDGPARCWYFRARHGEWSLAVGAQDAVVSDYVDDRDADLLVYGAWGVAYDAGYMPPVEARRLTGIALDLWLAGQRGTVELPAIHPNGAPNV